MIARVDCSRECLDTGTGCRLHHFALIHALNLKLLERRSLNALTAFAYAQEEMVRLREKREFMESLGISCTDEVDCKKREQVTGEEANCRRREKAVADAMAAEVAEEKAGI